MAAVLVCVGSMRCAPGDVLYVPFPPIEEGSMVLAVEQTSGDRRFVVQALEISATETLRLPDEEVQRDEDVTLDVLLYTGPLSEQNLDAGPLVEAVDDQPERTVPSSDQTFRLRLPGSDPEWELVDAPSDRLQRLRIFDPGPRDCATFTAEPFTLDDDASTEFAVSMGPDEVLISQLSGRLLRWTPSGLDVVQVTPNLALSHGVKDDVDGDWWFITRQGWLYRGTFDTPTSLSLTFYSRSLAPGITGRHRIVLRRDAGEPRIYSVRSNGLFQRFDVSGATTLHDFADADFGSHTVLTPDGDVVGAASGSALAAVVAPDGTLTLEEVPSGAGFTAAAYVDGVGTVLGSSEGRFFARRAGTWTEVGRSPLTVFVYAVAAHAGGFLYGGAFGAGGQYLPAGYCAVQDQLAAFTIQSLVQVSDGFLAFGQNPNVPDTPAQLIRLDRL